MATNPTPSLTAALKDLEAIPPKPNGISYDAEMLRRQFDEFAARHGRAQLLQVLLEAGRVHHLLIIAGPETCKHVWQPHDVYGEVCTKCGEHR